MATLSPKGVTSGVEGLTDYGTELVLGNIPNRYSVTKFGRTSAQASGVSTQDFWLGAGVYTGHPVDVTPELITVSSDDVNDTSGGTGARTVRISGLQSVTSTEYTTEDIVMNGTGLVDSMNSYYRVNEAFVLTAGSAAENIGTITVAHKVTTANVFTLISPTLSYSATGVWTVPFNSYAIIKRSHISIARVNGASGSATIAVNARSQGGVYLTYRSYDITTASSVESSTFAGTILPGGTDMKLSFTTISNTSTSGEAWFEFEIVKG